jgi:hypothetical protein
MILGLGKAKLQEDDVLFFKTTHDVLVYIKALRRISFTLYWMYRHQPQREYFGGLLQKTNTKFTIPKVEYESIFNVTGRNRIAESLSLDIMDMVLKKVSEGYNVICMIGQKVVFNPSSNKRFAIYNMETKKKYICAYYGCKMKRAKNENIMFTTIFEEFKKKYYFISEQFLYQVWANLINTIVRTISNGCLFTMGKNLTSAFFGKIPVTLRQYKMKKDRFLAIKTKLDEKTRRKYIYKRVVNGHQ